MQVNNVIILTHNFIIALFHCTFYVIVHNLNVCSIYTLIQIDTPHINCEFYENKWGS